MGKVPTQENEHYQEEGNYEVKVEILKQEFLQDIIDTVEMEGIPAELTINWDQTGPNLVPLHHGQW